MEVRHGLGYQNYDKMMENNILFLKIMKKFV